MRKSHGGRRHPIRYIVFGYGKTLIDPGSALVPGAKEVLHYLRNKQYLLKLVSLLSAGDTSQDRFDELQRNCLADYFEECVFRREPTKFRMLYDLTDKIPPEQIAVIDDRAADGRALHWGYLHGVTTIWLRRGMYAHELPPPERWPTHTIESLPELMGIL